MKSRTCLDPGAGVLPMVSSLAVNCACAGLRHRSCVRCCVIGHGKKRLGEALLGRGLAIRAAVQIEQEELRIADRHVRAQRVPWAQGLDGTVGQ